MLVKTFRHRNKILVLSSTLAVLSSCSHSSLFKSGNTELLSPSLRGSKETDNTESGPNRVPVWERAAGTFANIESPKTIPIGSLNLDKGAVRVGPVRDLQYAKDAWFNGIELYAALKQLNAPTNLDLVLLHFQNGMIIPIPRVPSSKFTTKVWIAKTWLDSSGKEIPGGFPPEARPGITKGDRSSLIFKGNKLIVDGPGHPFVPAEQTKWFSPWAHADSLVGIEFASFKAYYNQFSVSETPQQQHGYEAFMKRCQYCHGAQGVGAKLGWDFVTPMPLYQRRPHRESFITQRWQRETQKNTAGACRRSPICHPKKLMEFGTTWSVSPKPKSGPMHHERQGTKQRLCLANRTPKDSVCVGLPTVPELPSIRPGVLNLIFGPKPPSFGPCCFFGTFKCRIINGLCSYFSSVDCSKSFPNHLDIDRLTFKAELPDRASIPITIVNGHRDTRFANKPLSKSNGCRFAA
jgi:hypothetical protein